MNAENLAPPSLASRLDAIALWSGNIVSWMILPMVLSLTYEVVARYVFSAPTVWAYDMTFMLYGTFFMLGASYTLRNGGHIRTDMFYGKWKPKTQATVDLIGYIVLFYPLVCVFIFVGWGYFWKAFETSEKFVSSPWMPLTWPFKLVMPVTGVLLALQGLSEILKCVATMKTNKWPKADRHVE